MNVDTAICLACGATVILRGNGTLHPHGRYIEPKAKKNAGLGTIEPCPGSGKKPAEAASELEALIVGPGTNERKAASHA